MSSYYEISGVGIPLLLRRGAARDRSEQVLSLLAYWYKSTNTDAAWQPGGEEPVDRQRLSRLSEHVPRRHSGTPDRCSAC